MKYFLFSLSLFFILASPGIAHAQAVDKCGKLINQFDQLANLTQNGNTQAVAKEVVETFPKFCSIEDAIIWFIQGGLLFAASAAIIFIIIGGFQIILGSSGGESEGVAKGKKTLLYSVLGLAVILLSWVIVGAVNNIISRGKL